MGELLDALKDLLDNIKERGLTLFTVGSAVIVVFRFLEGVRKRRQEEEMSRDIKAIKRQLGVEEWKPGASGTLPMVAMSLRPLQLLYSVAVYQAVGILRRRRNEMNQQINWVSIVTATAGAGKIILQSFGIEIPQEQINEAINGAAAVVTIIGIFMSHRRNGGAVVGNSQSFVAEQPRK